MSESIEKFVSIPFLGTEIQATNDEKHYVALKPLVEGIGLKWDGILRKIKNNKVLSSTIYTTYIVADDGKNREMVCLPLDRINGLLFLVNTEDYNHNPELKERLEKYQELCYNALYQYFYNGVAVNPVMAVQPQEMQMQAFQNAINNAVSNTIEMARAQMAQMTAEFNRTKGQIAEKREATAMQTASVLSRSNKKLSKQNKTLSQQNQVLKQDSDKLKNWISKIGRPRKGESPKDKANASQMYLIEDKAKKE